MVDEKMFPMQGGPSLPWSTAQGIYDAYAAVFGTRQSMERMAERGGFGWAEVTAIGAEYRRALGRLPDGWSWCQWTRLTDDGKKTAEDTTHARIAELEAVLRDWVEATPEIAEDTRGVVGMQQDCLRRAKALLEGKP